MASGKNIRRTLLLSMTVVTAVAIAVLGYLWIWQEFARYSEDIQTMRAEKISSRKALIKEQVDDAVAYVEYKRSQADARSRSVIRERVYEAHSIATHIVDSYHDSVTLDELKDLVRETLRPLRFNNGRGYYFATSLDGVEELFADHPEMEGMNLLDMQDENIARIFHNLARIVRDRGEGFYTYEWTKPGAPGRAYSKVSFVKRFEPFDWYIGTGEYLDDMEQDLKKEALDWISKIRVGPDGYIFAGQWEGTSLVGPAAGQNMLDTTDPNGVKIVQELINAARSGGGYVSYVMPKLEGRRPDPKISYAAGVKDWQWYVGSGLYIDDIERAVSDAHAEMFSRVAWNIARILGILLLLLAASYFIAKHIADKIAAAFVAFSSFFNKASTESVTMSTEGLNFAEFENLAVSANRMISQRQQLEKERAFMADQLRHAQKMEALGQLAGGIAHDFNNLLQVISGYADMALLATAEDDARRANLRQVTTAAARAASLTRSLLAFSRRDSSNPEIVDLAAVVAKTTEMLRRVIGEHVNLIVKSSRATSLVCADPGQMEQILMNLTINARDAMPSGGAVTIETANVRLGDDYIKTRPEAVAGDYVRLSVSDTGVSIPPEFQGRIFEPFFTTKEVGSGTGLGLANVYAIVKQHDGLIDCESKPGVGTAFHIYLPAAATSSVTHASASGVLPAIGGNEIILLAEDDEAVRSLAVMLLEKVGYRVLVARDGQEAVDIAKDNINRIDIAVLDVVMPKKGGRDVYDALKTLRSNLPVLFASGYSAAAFETAPPDGETWNVIAKPYTSADLLAAIRRILDTAGA